MKTKAIKYLNSLITEDMTKKDIDLVEFIKKCVREHKEEKEEQGFDWTPFFEKLWQLYPRKVNKQLAKRTFEHKVRGLSEEQCREKCNKIYVLMVTRIKEWKLAGRDLQYYSHFSSFLNNEVPNSPKYKGV